MSRKETITVGLPPQLMRALEHAQEKLYRKAVGAGAPPGVRYSRAIVVEMALVEFLRSNGIKVEATKFLHTPPSEPGKVVRSSSARKGAK